MLDECKRDKKFPSRHMVVLAKLSSLYGSNEASALFPFMRLAIELDFTDYEWE